MSLHSSFSFSFFVLQILIDNSQVIRLCDFGLSRPMIAKESESDSCADTSQPSAGTVAYKAPELLSIPPKYTMGSDVWSLALVINILLTGDTRWIDEFTDENRTDLYVCWFLCQIVLAYLFPLNS